MKKLYFLAACLMCVLCASAQTVYNTGYLQITLNRNVLVETGGPCTLDSAPDLIYAHSGAGYKTSTSLWDAVVGNWGVPNGDGEMTTVSDSIYTLCLDLQPTASNYYSNAQTASTPDSLLPVGATIYNIGVVFRAPGPFPLNAQGTPAPDNFLKGAGPDIDSRGLCSDIWLIGVNSDSIGYQTQPIQVVEEDYLIDPYLPVTTTWVSSCPTAGIKNISNQLFEDIKASPNPFTDKVTISFNMTPDVTRVQCQVYDVLGRKVADFTPGIVGGYNSFIWDGAGVDGNALPTGTYLLKVTNGSQEKTLKLIKI